VIARARPVGPAPTIRTSVDLGNIFGFLMAGNFLPPS
jgi:hypothetical protein